MNSNKSESGIIFDIQGFSVHDGPGSRTLIFLKGCTLNCRWCSNPEGIRHKPQPLYYIEKCISCFACIKACPHHSASFDNEKIAFQNHLCSACTTYDCVHSCPAGAIKVAGYEISIDKLFRIIKRDRHYWGAEGGITLTGGEPLLQIDFAEALLKLAHKDYIHTAIETAGNVKWEYFERIMPFTDWIFFDIKQINYKRHILWTDHSNKLIISNFIKLNNAFSGKLIPRIPLIPDVNTGQAEINDFINFFVKNKVKEINLLPVHHLGKSKYRRLNADYFSPADTLLPDSMLENIRRQFENAGIKCYKGANTPF